MLRKLFTLRGNDEVLELEHLERILQASLKEVEPRSGYEGTLRSRLTDYSRTVPVYHTAHSTRYTPSTNDILLMLVGLLSGAAVLVMGIKVAILTIAGFGILRNMRREIETRRWQSPRAAG